MNNRTLWSIVGVVLLVVIALLLFGVISIPTTVITPSSAETRALPDSEKKIAEKQADGEHAADDQEKVAEKQADGEHAADDQEKVEFKIVE